MSIRPPAAVAAAQSVAVLADSTLGVAAATITFNNIPQTYKHLQVMLSGAGTDAGNTDSLLARYNNDSTAGHYTSSIIALYSTLSGVDFSTTTSLAMAYGFPLANPARTGLAELTVYDYASTVLPKASRSIGGGKTDAALTNVAVHQWTGTAAITRIDIFLAGAGNFIAGTRATLLGIG